LCVWDAQHACLVRSERLHDLAMTAVSVILMLAIASGETGTSRTRSAAVSRALSASYSRTDHATVGGPRSALGGCSDHRERSGNRARCQTSSGPGVRALVEQLSVVLKDVGDVASVGSGQADGVPAGDQPLSFGTVSQPQVELGKVRERSDPVRRTARRDAWPGRS